MKHQLKRLALGAALLGACIFTTSANADTFVSPTAGTDGWLGFMNVSDLPADGGGFQFGSGWGVDYNGNPNDIGGFGPDSIGLQSASIDDPAPFWFISGAPGAGAVGNKVMEANLYQEFSEGAGAGALGGMDLIFNFEITQFDFDSDVQAFAFITEFDPGFAGVFNTTMLEITGTGNFQIDLAIDGGQGAVQWGFQTINTVVWTGDQVNGGLTIAASGAAIPEPTSCSSRFGCSWFGSSPPSLSRPDNLLI